MKLRPIRTEEDYHMAIVKLQLLSNAKQGSEEADTFEVLNILIEHYERENAPMGMPDPLDSIKIFNQYFNTDKQDSDDNDSTT